MEHRIDKIARLSARIKNNLIKFGEATLDPRDMIDITGTNEELFAKTQGLILKTKLLMKNTMPNAGDNNINKIFEFAEENLNLLMGLESKGIYIQELLQDIYKHIYCHYKYNVGLCERVKSGRLEENNKLMSELLSQNKKEIQFKSDEPLKYKLTKKQVDILRLYSDGCERKEIVKKMNIKYTTLRNHDKAILRNLGAVNITEAVKVAIRNRLI